ATERGQITKREVRLLALAELGLHDEDVMWDVGAGSGSVSIEAARSNPSAQVYAIEKRDPFCRHIAHNISHLNAHNVHLIQGTAPGALTPLPDPDVVFIGGSGEHMTEIVKYVVERLRDGGRLVLNVVTLESLAAVRQTLPTAKVNQVNIQRGVPIADALRFEALNPVFIITWQKNKQ
ncbi:MAG: precorrin-6Y C5,15-methyltransferase (decarboxylating) subunit CbiT, partial [Chloroflexota bacterium]